jgi:hypothetical protein
MKYEGYKKDDSIIKWLWELLEEWNDEFKA